MGLKSQGKKSLLQTYTIISHKSKCCTYAGLECRIEKLSALLSHCCKCSGMFSNTHMQRRDTPLWKETSTTVRTVKRLPAFDGYGCSEFNHQVISAPLWALQAADQIKRLYDLFLKVDATQVEVNPLGETPQGQGTCVVCVEFTW